MNGPQSEVSTNVYTCVLIQCKSDTITQLSIVRKILSKSNMNVEQTFKKKMAPSSPAYLSLA